MKTMKNRGAGNGGTHFLRTTLLVLAGCCLLSLILAVILFNADPERTGASATLEFSFDGAASGKAPTGYRYNLDGLASDEVLEAALEETGLSGKYTAEQLRANLVISGIYPDDIVAQLTRYESLLGTVSGRVTVPDVYATSYDVTLYNDFDKSVSPQTLQSLLGSILRAFREDFAKKYSFFLSASEAGGEAAAPDAADQLEMLKQSVNQKLRYAQAMAAAHPDFRKDRKGFEDIVVRYSSLLSGEGTRLSSLIAAGGLVSDPERAAAQYSSEIDVLERRIRVLNDEAARLEALVNTYQKDEVVYITTDGDLIQLGDDYASTETYDSLITQQQSIAASLGELKKTLAQVKLKLEEVRAEAPEAKETAAAAGDAEKAEELPETAETKETAAADETAKAVADGLADFRARRDAISADFAAFLEAYSAQEINEQTIAVTAERYRTPKLLSTAFLKRFLRVLGPLCTLGLIACLIFLIRARVREDRSRQGTPA